MPWAGAVIVAVLALMGAWMFAGRGLYTGVFERFADPKAVSFRSFFLFGLAYGLASLSCTLPTSGRPRPSSS